MYAFVKGGREIEKGEVPDTDITAEDIKPKPSFVYI